MDRNSKYFLGFVALVIVLLVGYKFKQFIIDKDFTLIANIPCDPATESCFRVVCDPEGCDDSSGIVNSDGSPYKKITLPYSKAPNCLIEENCTPVEASQICVAGDTTCIIDTCSEDTLEDGEECVPAATDATGTETPATTETPVAN